MNLFVHNLSAQATEANVQDAFAVFGMVKATAIMKHKSSGKPRGFGFVVMPSDEEAQAAMHSLAGTEFLGRILTVREANLLSELRSDVRQEERG